MDFILNYIQAHLTISFLLSYLSVVIATILADVCWTMYFIETGRNNAVKAGGWSAMIFLGSAFAVTSYVTDKLLISAAMIGAFIGTYITVVHKNRQSKKEGT